MTRSRNPLTAAEKRQILERKRAGECLAAIARELQCSFYTVRKWWRCGRDGQERQRRGRPVCGALSTYPSDLRAKAIELKRSHPHWGPLNVRLELQRVFPWATDAWPSPASLARLFKERCPEAVQARTRRAYPEHAPVHVQYPHQRWQVDAQEGLALVPQEKVNLLDVYDPSGLAIGSHAFVTTTPKRSRKLTLRETQQALREDFASWGLPEEIQTDHEAVYMGSRDENFPSRFTLWLVGLGIEHVPSRPARPTDQAQVERHHRTQADLVWREQVFAQREDLQQALEEGTRRSNEEFPSQAGHCHGQPPLQAYPFARASGRPFDPAQEWWLFDLRRMQTFLAQFVCVRQVSTTGIATLSGHRYYVGKAYAGQSVSAQFIPQTNAFRFQTSDGILIRDLPAHGFNQADILGYEPVHLPAPQPFQLPLPIPLQGV